MEEPQCLAPRVVSTAHIAQTNRNWIKKIHQRPYQNPSTIYHFLSLISRAFRGLLVSEAVRKGKKNLQNCFTSNNAGSFSFFLYPLPKVPISFHTWQFLLTIPGNSSIPGYFIPFHPIPGNSSLFHTLCHPYLEH